MRQLHLKFATDNQDEQSLLARNIFPYPFDLKQMLLIIIRRPVLHAKKGSTAQ